VQEHTLLTLNTFSIIINTFSKDSYFDSIKCCIVKVKKFFEYTGKITNLYNIGKSMFKTMIDININNGF
jgi:hypothetical protein